MMWWPGGGGWTGWLFMSVSVVVFWGLIVAVIVVLVRGARPAAPETRQRPDALAILEERFARGEIDKQEFEERRATLQGR